MKDKEEERAQADLLEMLRGGDGQSFRLTVTCERGKWQVALEDLDQRSAYAVGEGKSFAEAWYRPSRKVSSKSEVVLSHASHPRITGLETSK